MVETGWSDHTEASEKPKYAIITDKRIINNIYRGPKMKCRDSKTFIYIELFKVLN